MRKGMQAAHPDMDYLHLATCGEEGFFFFDLAANVDLTNDCTYMDVRRYSCLGHFSRVWEFRAWEQDR